MEISIISDIFTVFLLALLRLGRILPGFFLVGRSWQNTKQLHLEWSCPFIPITTLFYKASLLQGEIWCWSLLGFKGLNGKKEIRNSLFQVLEGGLVGGKILKSFSVT